MKIFNMLIFITFLTTFTHAAPEVTLNPTEETEIQNNLELLKNLDLIENYELYEEYLSLSPEEIKQVEEEK